MKDKTREIALTAGFYMRPNIDGYHDGIDWSFSSHGYDECVEKLIDVVVRRCIAQVALVGLSNFENEQITIACSEAIDSIKEHFGVE